MIVKLLIINVQLNLKRAMIRHHFLHVLVCCDVRHFQLMSGAGGRIVLVSTNNTWQSG